MANNVGDVQMGDTENCGSLHHSTEEKSMISFMELMLEILTIEL